MNNQLKTDMKIPKRRTVSLRKQTLFSSLAIYLRNIRMIAFSRKYRRSWKVWATGAGFILLASAIGLLFLSQKPINDFNYTKGVLSLNTDKSSYTAGEAVLFQMGSLDPKGSTLCNSKLKLEIEVPNQKKKETLTAEKNQIITTATCSAENNVTNEADYIARFTTHGPGTYNVLLTNLDTGKKVKSSFIVQKEQPQFQIQRSSATRINPFKSDRYPMVITVTSQKDFKGQLVESLPSDFKFQWIGPAKNTQTEKNQVLTWDVELKAGEPKEFSYEYDAPDASPAFIRLGQATLFSSGNTQVYQESHGWQIASDAIAIRSETTGTAALSGGSNGFTVTRGTTATGDYIVVIAALEDDTPLTAPPSGQGWVTAEQIAPTTENDSQLGIFYKYVTDGSTEPSTYAFTTGNADDAVWWVGSLSGVAVNSPEDELMSDNAAEVVNGTTHTANSITTASAGAFVLAAFGQNIDTATTLPGGSWASRADDVTSGNIDLNVVSQTFSSTGATGNVAISSVDGASDGSTGQFAFRAADTITGIAYTDEGTTLDTSATICVAVEAATPICDATDGTTGVFDITTAGAKAGDQLTFFFDLGSEFGNTITVSDDGNIVGGDNLKVFQNTVIVRYETGSNINITQMDAYDNDQNSTDMLFDAEDASPDTVVLESNIRLHVQTGFTFAPGGNVTTAGTGDLHIDDNSTFTGAGSEAHVIGQNVLIDTGATFTAPTSGSTSAKSITITGTFTGGGTTLTLTGTSGTLFTRTGTFTANTSTISVTSGSGTPTLFSAATTIYNLTVNANATIVNSGATPTFATNGSLTVTAGVLNFDTGVTGPGASGTLTLGATGVMCLGGVTGSTAATCNGGATSTSAIAMPTFNTYTFNATSTVRYMSDADTTISNTPSYGNLSFTPTITAGRAYALGGAMTINGDFNVNPIAASSLALTVNAAGTITVAATKTTTLSGTTSGTSTLDLRPVATDYNLSTGLLNIATAGTLDAGSTVTTTITLTATSGTLFTRNGAFTITSGTPTVVFNGDGSPTALTSGTITFYNLSLTPAISSAGRTYAFGSGAITINGDFLIQPSGTQLLTVNMAGNITVDPAKTTTITRSNTATSSLATGASNPALSSGSITVATGGTLDGTSSTSTISLTKTSGTPLSLSGDNFTEGSTTVTYIPGSGTANTITSTTYYNLTLNHTGTTFSLTTSGITVTNDLTITAGVLDTVNGSNYPIAVGRNWTNSVGTAGFEAQQGTVTFNTTTTASITGTTTFYNFTAATAGKTIKFGDSTTFTINGLLTLTGSSGPTYVTLDSVSGGTTQWTINHQGTESVTYTSVKNSACSSSPLSSDITANDGSNNNAGNNGSCWLFASAGGGTATTFWKLDEGHDSTVYDTGGSSNSGTITNAVWKTSDLCVSDKCLYFDGSGDFVSRTDDPDLDMNTGESVTVELWFRHPDIATNPDYLVAKHDGTEAGYKIYMNADGTVTCGIDGDSTFSPTDSTSSTAALDDNKWHHLACVKSTTTSLKLYVDGQAVGTEDTSIQATVANNDTFYLGIDGDGSSNGWEGFIDEFRFFRTARTAAQIKTDLIARGNIDGDSARFGPDNKWLSDGLVGYWRMDDNTGTTTVDSSGNGGTGTFYEDQTANSNGPTWTAGKFGPGINFAGTEDVVRIPSSTATNLGATTDSYTVSVWFKTTTNFAATAYIAAKTGGSSAYPFRIQMNSSETISFLFHDASGGVVPTSTATYNDGLWHQAVGVRNVTTDTAYLYIDGISVSSANDTTTGSLTNSDDLSIGNGGISYVESDFTGQIDSVRIYNRALSPAEVNRLYNSAPGPIAYYNFNENTGTSTINDISGNGGTGTMAGSMTTSDWVPGKYGSSLDFDGSDDHISLTDGSIFDLNVSNSYTWSMWVNPSSLANWDNIWSQSIDNAHFFFIYVNDDSSRITADLETASGSQREVRVSTTNPVSANTWSYVTVTFDGSKTAGSKIDIYVNGILKNGTGSTTGTIANLNPTTIWIGDDNEFASEEYTGRIDEFRFYNYARTPGQIIEDMNAGHPVGGSPVGSPVAYWKFDEGYGTSANDNSINSNTLTLNTASWTTSGKYSKAWNGTGGDIRMSRTTDPDLEFSDLEDFSISLWYKSDSANNPGSTEYLIDNATIGGAGTSTAGYAIYANTSGNLCFAIDDDTTWDPDIASCTTTDVYDNTWHHIAAIRDHTSSDKTYIYVDGTSRDSDSDTTTATLDSNVTFFVGDIDTNDDGEEFAGDIDELKIYRASLTPDQIKTEFDQGKATKMGTLSTNSGNTAADDSAARAYCIPGDTTSCSPAIAHWALNENSGTSTINDISGNGNTGTMNGSMTQSDWVLGKFGSALDFDGSNDFITMANESNFDFERTDHFSFSFWLKPNLADTAIQLPLTKNADTALRGWNIELNHDGAGNNDPGKVGFYLINTVNTNELEGRTSNDTNLYDGNWHHYGFTYDGSSTIAGIKIYEDGISLPITDAGSNLNATILNNLSVAMAARSDGSTTYNELYTGIMDDVRVYNYTRTPAQIAWDYNRGAPVIWYKLDEASGIVANNSAPVGNGADAGNDGSTSGATVNQSGKIGTSYDFDGTNDIITTANANAIDFDIGLQNGMSYSFWVYANSDGEADLGEMFDKGANTYCRTDTQGTTDLDLECQIDLVTAEANLNITDGLTTDTWTHVVVTYSDDGDDELTIYINGINRGSSSGGDGAPQTTDNNDLIIGGDTAHNFDGQLDDFRIYNYELSSTQVKTLYNNGSVSFK